MKKQRIRIFASILVLGLALLSTGCSTQETVAGSEEKYVPVEVKPALVQTLVETTTFSGKIISDQEVSIVPKMPGKVTAVKVKVGDKVEAGTVLFTLDTADIQKSIDTATFGYNTAEKNYSRLKEQVDSAKENVEQMKKLFAVGAITQEELMKAEAQAQALEKQLDPLQIQRDQAKLGLTQAQDAINNTITKAPIAGTVTAVNVKYGEMASSAMPSVVISQMDTLNVAISVPENIVNTLQIGQEAKVRVNSAGDEERLGKITSIAPSADARTQLYAVKVLLENPEGIRPGMFANVEIPTETKENVLTVKSEAVVLKNGQNTVFIVENDRAVSKQVVPGMDTGSEVEITEGLEAGAQVIIKGQTFVEQGSKIKVVGGSAS